MKNEPGDVRERMEGLLDTPPCASPTPPPEWREVRKRSKEERKSVPREQAPGRLIDKFIILFQYLFISEEWGLEELLYHQTTL